MKYQKGDVLMITGNTEGHHFAIGDTVFIQWMSTCRYLASDGVHYWYVCESDIELLERSKNNGKSR